MPPYLAALLGLGGFLLGCAGFVAGRLDRRKDDAMRFGDHWRAEANALLEENERLRLRTDDVEKDCVAQLAALRSENEALGQRIIQLVKTGRIGGPP